MPQLPTPRAVIVSQDPNLTTLLTELLFRHGLKETVHLTAAENLENLILKGILPIVFINQTPGIMDAFAQLDEFWRLPGHELLPYFVLSDEDDGVLKRYGTSAGATGYIAKPLQPIVLQKAIQEFIPIHFGKKSWHQTIYDLSLSLIKKDDQKSINYLNELNKNSNLQHIVTLIIARIHKINNKKDEAEITLQKLVKKDDFQIRAYCEYADFLMQSARIKETVEQLDKIYKLHPQLTFRLWEQAILYLEIDEPDLSCKCLDELTKESIYKEQALEALVRILIALGVEDQIPHSLLRHSSQLDKNFQKFLSSCDAL